MKIFILPQDRHVNRRKMSRRLQKAKAYLYMLLYKNTPSYQVKWLLQHPSDQQLSMLTEIAHNFAFNNSVLPPNGRKKIKTANKILTVLGKEQISAASKRELLKKHATTIARLLQYLETFLKSIVK